MRSCIFSLAFLLIASGGFAQKIRKTKPNPGATEGYVSVGAMVNVWQYMGDIPSGVNFLRPGASLYFSRKVTPHWHARLQLSVGRLEGDDASAAPTSGIYARNLHFRNDIKELSGLLVYELKGSYSKYTRRASFSPYLMGGIGLLHHNPRAKMPTELGNSWIELQPLGTEGQGRIGYGKPYNKTQIVIPFGLGLRFRTPDKRWDFAIEVMPRYTFTDYLDDVGGEYPNMDDLGNPWSVALSNRTLEGTTARTNQTRQLDNVFATFGAPVSYVGFDGQTYQTLGDFRRGKDKRGNPNTKDLYLSFGFHLSYILDVGLKCPQARW